MLRTPEGRAFGDPDGEPRYVVVTVLIKAGQLRRLSADERAACERAGIGDTAHHARCDVDIEFGVYHVPVYDPEDQSTPDDYFAKLCRDGAIERYGEITDQVQERLDYEVGIIKKLGFVSYFLITWDFIKVAKDMGIPVGPGRGSAAAACAKAAAAACLAASLSAFLSAFLSASFSSRIASWAIFKIASWSSLCFAAAAAACSALAASSAAEFSP